MHRHYAIASLTGIGGLLGAMIAAVPAIPAAAATGSPQIVISGLNNPRGITFASNGTMYVAESGTGGSGPCITSSEGGSVCYGPTGAITALPDAATVNGKVATSADRLVSGLPSLATQTDNPSTPQPDAGTSATGPADVTVAADGTIYFPIGLGAPPASRQDLTKAGAPGADLASLWSVKADGTGKAKVADLGNFEQANNPDNGVVPTSSLDTNPYSALALSATSVLVADAGGNDVLSVNPADGSISVSAVLPEVRGVPQPLLPPLSPEIPPILPSLPPGTALPAQPVPDSLAAGPNNTTYVGQLTGFPFPPGGASIFTLNGTTLTRFSGGLTNVIDEAVGPDGNLYVLEIAHNSLLGQPPVGALLRISADGGTKQLLLNNLNFPGGIAFGPDKMAYITTCTVCTGQGPSPAMTGNVVRFDAVGAQPLLTRVSGVDRIATAAAASRATFPGGTSAVVIARADTYVDAMTGSVLAAVAGTPSSGKPTSVPLLLTSGNQLATATAVEISRLHATTAYVLGQTDAISDAVVQQLKAQTGVTTVVRVGGADRFATAAAIKAKVEALTGAPASAVYITRSDVFADAMAVSSLAAHQVRPILLVTPNSLPPETATALGGVTSATIVGGTQSVSQAVSDAIATHVTTVTPRLAGSDRYATSVAVAKAAIAAGLDASKLWIATGRNWPDAVAAGPAIAAAGAVLLLVDPTDLALSAASKQFLATSPASTAVTILGGPATVMVPVEQQILAALAP